MHASNDLFIHLLIVNCSMTSHPGNWRYECPRHVQAWEHVHKALVIGKQLKDWTAQSSALRGAFVILPVGCDPVCYTRTQPFATSPFLVSFQTIGSICNLWHS